MVLIEDPGGQIGHLRGELPVTIQHHRFGLGKIVFLIRLGQRGVDVIPAQFLEPQPASLEAEVALEDAGILPADRQQGIHHLVGQIIAHVAGGDGGGIAAQFHRFRVPVAHPVAVDLRQDGGILAIDPVKFLVGRPAKSAEALKK